MTIHDFIRIQKITIENVESWIKKNQNSWFGAYGEKIDYEVTPKGISLNKFERHGMNENYKFNDLKKIVLYGEQLTLF